jgi:His-Xaa-Ser system radical SAM maturase HxsC
MIQLTLPCTAEAPAPFVTRLRSTASDRTADHSVLVGESAGFSVFSGQDGLFEIALDAASLDGDVVLVDPLRGRVDRLLRPGPHAHNTLLVTERCDQLCVMCSQPPRKSHDDRFALLERACLLADPDVTVGITGGEPTLYKEEVLSIIERVGAARPDLDFHILTNAQHFDQGDAERLRDPRFRRVTWGVPLYSTVPSRHDEIVGKFGAFERLEKSMAVLLLAGAQVELRTVVLTTNVDELPALARHVTGSLGFVRAWSIMQLENIGFARGRWGQLRVDHAVDFAPIGAAMDHALLHGVPARLFNFPLCSVPAGYREHAAASISDWKRKYAPACDDCGARDRCTGFFEWHPDEEARATATPI